MAEGPGWDESLWGPAPKKERRGDVPDESDEELEERTAADTFNPVYPYEPEAGADDPNQGSLIAPMPPFYDTGDFTGGNGGLVLSLRTVDPVVRTGQGLGLKLGSNLYIDADGQLTASLGQQLSAQDPLKISDGVITFKRGPVFKINSDGSVGIKVGPTLKVEDSNGNLQVVPVAPLSRSSAGLNLDFAAPLEKNSDQKLALNISTPLRIENNSLKVNYLKPLYETTNNELSVRYGSTLEVPEDGQNQLQVKAKAPLTKDQDGLGLATGAALQVIGHTLAVKYVAPLTVDSTSALTVNPVNVTYIYGTRVSYPLQLTVYKHDNTIVSGNAVYADLLFIKTGPISTMRFTVFANNRNLSSLNMAQFKINFNNTTGSLVSDEACQGIMGYLTEKDTITTPSPIPLRSFLPALRDQTERQTYCCPTYFGEGGWQEGSNNGPGHCSVNYSVSGSYLVLQFRAVATMDRKLNFNLSCVFYTE